YCAARALTEVDFRLTRREFTFRFSYIAFCPSSDTSRSRPRKRAQFVSNAPEFCPAVNDSVIASRIASRAMSTASDPVPGAAPDRLFDRASGVILCCGFAIVVAAHVILDHAVRRQIAAAELAVSTTTEVTSARIVMETLNRFAAQDGGPSDSADRNRLVWDIDRLTQQEADRVLRGGLPIPDLDAAAAEAIALA